MHDAAQGDTAMQVSHDRMCPKAQKSAARCYTSGRVNAQADEGAGRPRTANVRNTSPPEATQPARTNLRAPLGNYTGFGEQPQEACEAKP
jgi:hypothetical protein